MAPRPHLVGEHSVDPGEVPPNAEQDDLYVGGERSQEPNSNGTIVAKIGGSTLGEHDTTLKDIVELQKRGAQAVVVHGGGKVITEWMARGGVRPKFVRGLRVTNPAVLEIVVAVLTGVVNKSLVSSIQALGGRAIGLSGVDGGMLKARPGDPELGLVGGEISADPDPIRAVLTGGFIPVIAPVASRYSQDDESGDSMLNVNADTAAGEIAAALNAESLVFLTDVAGVLDSSRRLIPRLTERQARSLMSSDVVEGGMVPKLEACLTALKHVEYAQIVDGRKPRALLDSLSGESIGTRVG